MSVEPKQEINLTKVNWFAKSKSRKSTGKGYRERIQEKFIKALKQGNDLLARGLLLQVKDDLTLLDNKYNLVHLIYNSSRGSKCVIQWINEFISSCNSVVTSDVLLFCVIEGNIELVKLLLSRGSDPNASCSVSGVAFGMTLTQLNII